MCTLQWGNSRHFLRLASRHKLLQHCKRLLVEVVPWGWPEEMPSWAWCTAHFLLVMLVAIVPWCWPEKTPWAWWAVHFPLAMLEEIVLARENALGMMRSAFSPSYACGDCALMLARENALGMMRSAFSLSCTGWAFALSCCTENCMWLTKISRFKKKLLNLESQGTSIMFRDLSWENALWMIRRAFSIKRFWKGAFSQTYNCKARKMLPFKIF